MTPRCPAVDIWPNVGIGYIGVRLTCCLPAGHPGDHKAADFEAIQGPQEAQ